MSAFYAMWHGPDGLTLIAERIRTQALSLRSAMSRAGLNVSECEIFDTLTVSGIESAKIAEAASQAGFNFRLRDAQSIGITLDETVTSVDLETIAQIFGGNYQEVIAPSVVGDLSRQSEFLSHPLFNTYRSETSMLRYLRSLADKDLALDRTMIPLGSCTMKLNATTEMIPVTWPEFSNHHPFAPAEQSAGIRALIDQLSDWLIEITGYDAVSLQPSAG